MRNNRHQPAGGRAAPVTNRSVKEGKTMLNETAFGGALLRQGVKGLIVVLALAASSLTLDVHPAAADAAPEAAAPEAIVHQVPQVPLTINGKPVAPETVTKYNGRPLYMAVAPGGSPNGQLQAFTEPADFERYVREQGGPEHATAKPQRVLTPEAAARNPIAPPQRPESGPGQPDRSVNSPTSWIFSGDFYWFFFLGATEFTGYADLTKVDMVCAIWCVSWNDEASSAIPSDSGLLLFEHIGFTGSELFIPAGMSVPFLSRFGWDNRTSSFVA